MENQNNQGNHGFLPNFCDVNVLFMLILLVELLALILALASSEVTEFWVRLSFISLFTQWLALANAALLCLWRDKLNRLSVLSNGLISFAIMMSVTLLFSLLVIYFGHNLGVYKAVQPSWTHYYLLRNLAVSAVVYAVVLRYFYIQFQWEYEIKAQGMAQLQALKARIRPHFLFNSMNTIASLISISPDKAEKAVEDLSDLFRASLQEQTVHSLHDEIELTRSYLAIEQLRLGTRLSAEWQLGIDDDELEIPALSLQPLVENAIYHGIEPLPEGGNIKITSQIDNNRLCLSVSNPLGDKKGPQHSRSNHMAQDNIHQRLILMYGDRAKFETEQQQNQYIVRLWIPIDADYENTDS
ncbi:MAG: sensor histidine kinase [Gammaproteobacteria bacterium]